MPAKKITKDKPTTRSTAVRKTSVPRAAGKPAANRGASTLTAHGPAIAAAAKPEVTFEQVAQRAYEIWCADGGAEFDNWVRAERELKSV